MNRFTDGFTLIELMITVAIVGILAAIAYPSYQESVRKGARADAKSTLLNISQTEERYFTNNNTYRLMSSAAGSDAAHWQNYAGTSVNSRKYDITVTAGATGSIATSFKVIATPSNNFADSRCGKLSYDSDGTKYAELGTVAYCW